MMYKKKRASFYLKCAAIFGVIGWSSFFVASALFAAGYIIISYYIGGFSIFVGWFVSGYFWLRYGLIMGKSLKEIILRKK
jgi:hypothetical protein